MKRIELIVLAVSLTGCANFEPYQRTDVWSPSGANAGNIAAMAARPSDLIAGRSSSTGDAHQATSAIDRIWQDQPKPLPDATNAPPPSGGAAPASGGSPAPSGGSS